MAERQQEIADLKIASEGGYGPHLYYANADEAVIIMESLKQQPITNEQRNSGELYVALAHLLQKIHHGPSYKESINIFDRIHDRMNTVQKIILEQSIQGIPLEQLEDIRTTIDKAFAAYTLTAPCHNDLHPGNVLFLGKEFKVIDYERAAQTNPYFDIATIAIFFCFDPALEHLLLATYLEREPSAQQAAQLYLMKQAAWLSYAFRFLNLGSQKIDTYASAQVPSYMDFMREVGQGKIDLEQPESRIKLAKIMINNIITNAQSQEFHDAVELVMNGQ
jgi:thiamine kinase-like enzyme